ncbi:hypothetical protein [Roseisalinus antarcticus]|uniref:Excalibur calcium-binding domain-containing protein n=1 Tax=Roseisalinus antarcticus TaxID=254357 RepID=A0A1Y5SQL6_9RHOB|nr:hypothetical protein [Roseisalinus antarcticus]SLN46174.1 hypothetical protein ROA7023_01898 [Roseisalinus antarcticus]
MRGLLTTAGVLVMLGACSQPVPDSGQGVGFGDYETYQSAPVATPAPGGQGAAITAEELAAVGIGPQPSRAAAGTGAGTGSGTDAPLSATAGAARPIAGPGTLPLGFPPQRDTLAEAGRAGAVEATPGNAAPVLVNNPGLSDEQDFGAVSDRRSIEGDARRRAEAAAAYQVVGGGVPERSGETGPNIVAYALQTTNARGQRVYQRFAPSQSRFQRNCAAYRTPDEAQRDFLTRGGPDTDRLGLDPDGDGFACGWDPAPFRAARGS